MLVQVNTDNYIKGDTDLTQRVQMIVEDTMGRFSDQITRVEVHLKDVNGHKSGTNDKFCHMEARVAGLQPITVNHEADTIDQAVDGAVEKLERSVDSTLGQISRKKGRTSFAGDEQE